MVTMTTDKPEPSPVVQPMIDDLDSINAELVEELDNQLLDNLIYGTPLPGQKEQP